ncbi:MAG: hypothetical protein ACR2K1_10375 [Saprospiraceae bacterium]
MAGWTARSVIEPVSGGYLYALLPDAIKSPGGFAGIAAFLLALIQSILVYDLAGRYRLVEPRNWLPSLVCVLIAASLPDFSYLSAPLLAGSLLPLVWGKLFGIYKKAVVISTVFDIGFLLALSALIYPPVLLLTIPAMLGMRSLRSLNMHERLLVVAGIVTPWFLLWTWAFWNDQTGEFWRYNWGAFSLSGEIHPPADGRAWIQLGFTTLLALIVFFSLGSYYFKKLIQTQKYFSIVFWFLLSGIALQFLFNASALPAFSLITLCLGILIGYTLGVIRNALLAEFLHLAMLATVLILQYYSFIF